MLWKRICRVCINRNRPPDQQWVENLRGKSYIWTEEEEEWLDGYIRCPDNIVRKTKGQIAAGCPYQLEHRLFCQALKIHQTTGERSNAQF